MALDRTKTIKRRKVDVYLPTMEDRARWQAAARRAGLSVSRWIWNHVEAGIQREADAGGRKP